MKAKYNPDKSMVLQLYEKGYTQREIGFLLGYTQKVIWRAMRDYGIKSRVAANRNQLGPMNKNWKGDNVSYSAAHTRIYKALGQPNICEVCGDTDQSKHYEWANISGNFSDPNDYKRMCRSCHKKHDNIVRNLRK